jgi:hypothetical protein
VTQLLDTTTLKCLIISRTLLTLRIQTNFLCIFVFSPDIPLVSLALSSLSLCTANRTKMYSYLLRTSFVLSYISNPHQTYIGGVE